MDPIILRWDKEGLVEHPFVHLYLKAEVGLVRKRDHVLNTRHETFSMTIPH